MNDPAARTERAARQALQKAGDLEAAFRSLRREAEGARREIAALRGFCRGLLTVLELQYSLDEDDLEELLYRAEEAGRRPPLPPESTAQGE